MTTAEKQLQTLNALEQANMVRLNRATLKRKIHSGETTVAAVLIDQSDYIATMPVLDLLKAQRNWGAVRAAKILKRLGIPENKKAGTLTTRQVALLQGGLACSQVR